MIYLVPIKEKEKNPKRDNKEFSKKDVQQGYCSKPLGHGSRRAVERRNFRKMMEEEYEGEY